MPQLLSNLFSPIHSSYHYNKPKEAVKQQIEAVISKGVKFVSEPDLSGRFVTSDSFVFSTSSGAYTGGIKFGSTLQGNIIGAENDVTRLETKTEASSAYKIACYILLLFGGVLLIKAIYDSSLDTLGWAVVLLVLGPAVCNWMAGIANETVLDRYKRYIDKELRATRAPGMQQ